jgi:hypothetical protein
MLYTRQPHYTIPPSPFRKGKRTCPVCGRTGDYHCSVTQDGRLAICKFIVSDRPTQDGRYIHILNPLDFRALVIAAPKPVKANPPERAQVDRLNDVYSALLSDLVLTAAHGDELLIGRGLSDTTIARNLFASVPDTAKGGKVAASLARRFDLCGVPGFYCEEGRWRLNVWAKGFYIPCRDERGRIVGVQIRRDGNADPKYVWLSSRDMPDGTPASACLHFSKPDIAERRGKILVTEGALKAERISDFTDLPVVALAGVTAMLPETFIQRLLRALPRLKGVKVCFDMDWQKKPEVRSALLRLLRNLKESALEVKGATWDIALGKGYDDYLLNIMGRTA